jgi:hypothetical protein
VRQARLSGWYDRLSGANLLVCSLDLNVNNNAFALSAPGVCLAAEARSVSAEVMPSRPVGSCPNCSDDLFVALPFQNSYVEIYWTTRTFPAEDPSTLFPKLYFGLPFREPPCRFPQGDRLPADRRVSEEVTPDAVSVPVEFPSVPDSVSRVPQESLGDQE